MSTYADLAAMKARYPHDELVQLTDDAGAQAVDDAKLQQALDDAEEWINSYLSGQHQVPIAPVPQLLIGYACAVARYHLQEARGGATEAVQGRYEAIRTHLRDIGAGKAQLGVDAGGDEVATESGAGPTYSAPDRVFTSDKLKNF